jgi:hypothetical protein
VLCVVLFEFPEDFIALRSHSRQFGREHGNCLKIPLLDYLEFQAVDVRDSIVGLSDTIDQTLPLGTHASNLHSAHALENRIKTLP